MIAIKTCPQASNCHATDNIHRPCYKFGSCSTNFIFSVQKIWNNLFFILLLFVVDWPSWYRHTFFAIIPSTEKYIKTGMNSCWLVPLTHQPSIR